MSPNAGTFTPQNHFLLNMDQYSDASDSEDEPEGALKKKEKFAKEAPSPAMTASTQELNEPAPEPAGGYMSITSSPTSTPASWTRPTFESDCSDSWHLGQVGKLPSAYSTNEVEPSSASEPEAEGAATWEHVQVSTPGGPASPWRPREREPWRPHAALKVSDGSWAAQQRARRSVSDVSGGMLDDAEVVRRMKSILNKLTIEKFPVLYQKLLSSGIHTAGHAEALIREVFEKATTQHHFVAMYADLCALLQEHFENNPVQGGDTKFSFRRLLLNECQLSFERNLTPPAELDDLDKEERTLVEFQYKTRMLGNIKFVGALLTRKMLASKVMFAIIEELLALSTPEALESLAALLTAVGGTFDRPEWSYRDMLGHVFAQIKSLTDKADCNPRARCLLKDLLDLRDRGWKDTRPKRCEGPTTLQGVARQAAAEERAATMRPSFRGRART